MERCREKGREEGRKEQGMGEKVWKRNMNKKLKDGGI